MNAPARVALVTGAGHRLGRALALGLGRAGMRVAVHYNASAFQAAETLRELRAKGTECEMFGADLSDPAGPATLVQAVHDTFGALDIVINSAAVMERTPLGEVSAEQWDAMFAINVRAPFFISQAAAPLMQERGGVIINIADLAAFESWPAYVPHSITKAAVVKLTSALARVLAPAVRVNAIAPGTVLLPAGWDPDSAERLRASTPLGRLGDPEDVVEAMLYLLNAEYVTGETLIVDGGRHVRK